MKSSTSSVPHCYNTIRLCSRGRSVQNPLVARFRIIIGFGFGPPAAFRDRVVARFVPGSTFRKSHDGQQPTSDESELGQCLDGVGTTTRFKTAGRQAHGGDPRPVQLDQEDDSTARPHRHRVTKIRNRAHHAVDSMRRCALLTAPTSCCSNSGSEQVALPGNARTTTIVLGSQSASNN